MQIFATAGVLLHSWQLCCGAVPLTTTCESVAGEHYQMTPFRFYRLCSKAWTVTMLLPRMTCTVIRM